MNWVQKLILQTCKKFGICSQPGFDGFQIGSHRVRIVEDDPTYTIKVFDLKSMIPPTQIDNIYWDELEASLEETVRSIR